MNKYLPCGMDSNRTIAAETMKEAAAKLAMRLARKKYGRCADVRTCEIDSWSADGKLAEFCAFIGKTTGNETVGNNERFTLRLI